MTITMMTLRIDECEHSGDSSQALSELRTLGASFTEDGVFQCEEAEVAFVNIRVTDGGQSLRDALKKDEYNVSIAHSNRQDAAGYADQEDYEFRENEEDDEDDE